MTAHGQVLRVTAANASNSAIYDVKFAGSGGTTTTLNTDQTTHLAIQSLVFVASAATGTIDLIAADSARGELLLYTGAAGASQLIWSRSQGPGPDHPDGLSVDAAGNLFVVSSEQDDDEDAMLWVLPRNNPSGPGGYGLPRLIDRHFGGRDVEKLTETLVARSTRTGVGLGDLLVLSGEPASLFVYSASNIASVLAGGPEISPAARLLGPSQFPSDSQPGGMDIWPLDNSLLITTSKGRVLRFSAAGVPLPDFASGLGNGKFRIRTGWEDSKAYAFVANRNGGSILKFADGGGANPPVAAVTSGVLGPQGLATTNLSVVSKASCLAVNGGCNVLGDVIKHTIRNVTTAPGFLIEDICVVQADPRVSADGLTYTKATLPLSGLCPGFGDGIIPDSLYGGAGPAGRSFAVIKSTTGSPITKGALIFSEATAESVLGTPILHPCPETVLAWAPTSNEGQIAEGSEFEEVTSACGSSIGMSRDDSVWIVGLTLKQSALTGGYVGYAVQKFNYLSSTIAAASIQAAFRPSLIQCIAKSRTYFNNGKYLNAAGQLRSCDLLVAAKEALFTGIAANPNPSGDIRSRIANLYLTIVSRILPNTPPVHDWDE
jgi:hypothetical protein